VTRRFDTISFLSDFGLDDEFVGVVHSVVRSIAPHVSVIDITHGITPHDVRAGGLSLARSANYLNPGVVMAVVDPGVGSARRPVALEVGGGMSVLIGPDNGLLAPAVGLVGGATRAVELTSLEHRLESLGSTFDGRDVFAPAAAHICNGVSLTDLGIEIDPASLVPAVLPVSREENGVLIGEVLWIDRFGNCQINIDPVEVEALGDELRLSFGEEIRTAVRCESFDQISAGRVGLLIDSGGLISIAVARSSAAVELGLMEGSELRLSTLAGPERPSPTPIELSRKEDRS